MLVASVLAIVSRPEPSAAEINSDSETSWGLRDRGNATLIGDSTALGWALEQVDNTMYVGGNFLTVTNGSRGGDQSYLASFDADTGVWQSWFQPNVNGAVYALQAAPDGGLFVGGEFSTWNGVNTGGFVKIDPVTGDLWPGWAPRVSGARAMVVDMKIEADGQLYVVGDFGAVSSAAGSVSAADAIRMNPTTGVVDSSWTPRFSGGAIWGVARSRTQNVTYFTGQFRSVNGNTNAAGFAGVDDSAAVTIGAGIIEENNCQSADPNTCHWQFDVEATEFGDVWVAGLEHSLRVFDENNNYELKNFHYTACDPSRNNNCSPGDWFGGDFQEIERVGDRIYTSCHCWFDHYSDTQTIVHTEPTGRHSTIDSLAAYSASNTNRIESFRPVLSGRAGAWAIHVNPSDGCLWATGGFSTYGPIGSQTVARDLIRLCDEAGPGPTAQPDPGPPGPTSCDAEQSGSTMTIAWPAGSNVEKVVVERRINAGGTFFWRAAPAGDTTTFSESVPNNSTVYRIAFSYFSGQRSSYVTCSSGPPEPAASCSARVLGSTRVEVSWVSGANSSSFRIYRSENGGARVEDGSIGGTEFSSAVVGGNRYTYDVVAISGDGMTSAATSCGTVRVSKGSASG